MVSFFWGIYLVLSQSFSYTFNVPQDFPHTVRVCPSLFAPFPFIPLYFFGIKSLNYHFSRIFFIAIFCADFIIFKLASLFCHFGFGIGYFILLLVGLEVFCPPVIENPSPQQKVI